MILFLIPTFNMWYILCTLKMNAHQRQDSLSLELDLLGSFHRSISHKGRLYLRKQFESRLEIFLKEHPDKRLYQQREVQQGLRPKTAIFPLQLIFWPIRRANRICGVSLSRELPTTAHDINSTQTEATRNVRFKPTYSLGAVFVVGLEFLKRNGLFPVDV